MKGHTIPKWVYLLPWILGTVPLCALPELSDIAAGQAECLQVDSRTLSITASDRAILHFSNFQIADGEHVQFIQPSLKSSVLSRVTGKNESEIFGKLSANGRVFLVNPNGIVFGPNAIVNTGSFLASTLNIRDEDFLKDNYVFALEPGSEKASIINHGLISASPEGFVALLAPFIENRGSILARAGRVVLASAERVTLDFAGDGLIQFTVDGELKQALIENFGEIQAIQGAVDLSMRTARHAIKMVVNTDGITPANALEEVNGVIHLLHTSKVSADRVRIEGATQVEVSGEIDASRAYKGELGGRVEVLGDHLHLAGARIDASGDVGGGSVRIGGEYQGKGKTPTAENTVMDAHSVIVADALSQGNGGEVILWADETTLFDGTVYARGGAKGGDGGFVETSGKLDLGIETGFVDTSAPLGQFGNWLLDPSSVIIVTGGSSTVAQCSAPNCANGTARTIAPATIAAAASNVALCAQNGAGSSITVTNAVTMTNVGVSLSLTAGSTNVGPIALNANITTRGGAISLVGVTTLGANVVLDATNAGATPAGANISFSSTINGSGARTLTLRGGTAGVVSFGGAVGGVTPLVNLSFISASSIQIGSNIVVTGANPLLFPSPVSLTGTSAITSNNANVTFSSTLNGAQALTINGGSGITTFTGAVGGTTPLNSLSATAATLAQNSTSRTTGALSYTGSTAINVNGNITTSGGIITMTGPVAITGALTFDSTNAGGTAAGANISFSSTLNGATSLTLRAGTGGVVSFGGAVGNTTPLTNLTFTSASSVQVGGNVTVTGANPLVFGFPVSLTGTSTITSNNANVTFSSTLNGAQALTVTGGIGTTTFTGAVGGTTPLNSLGVTAATITQSSSVRTTGVIGYTGVTAINLGGNLTTSGSTITMTGPVNLTGTVVEDTTNAGASPAGASLSFSSTINGANPLTLNAGTGGSITFTGAVGGVTRIGALTITNATHVTANAITAASIAQSAGSGTTTFNGILNTNGASGISISTNIVNINANVTTTNLGVLSVTHSGLLTVPSGVILTLDGGFSDNGPGATSFGGTIVTNGRDIVFSGALTLPNSISLSTGTGIGNIAFLNTVNGTVAGAQNLNLTADGGNITFSSAVGGTTRLGSLQINSANNVTAASLTATTITQVAGTGTSTFNGAINLNNASGFVITGHNVSINNTVTTTSSGPVSVTLDGTLVFGSSAAMTLDGAFSQLGTGTVQSAGSITTTNDTILFTGAVSLTGANTLNTGAGIGDIQFMSTLNGPGALNLSAGTGAISVAGSIGSTTRLGALAITSGASLSTTSVSAVSINESGVTGLSTFAGNLNTNGAAGVQLVGTAFTINGNLISTNGGPFTVTHSGALNLTAGASTSLSGAFTESGAGTLNVSGTVLTINAGISFANTLNLTGALSLNSSAGVGSILLSNSVTGAQPFSLSSGAADITLSGAIGSPTPVTTMTISSANNVSTQAISAASLSQVAGTGTTTFNGALTTTGASGINLTGAAFTFNNPVTTTTGSGPLLMSNTAIVTFAAGATANIGGALTQSGSGGVSLANTMTVGGAISFASAVSIPVSETANLSTAATLQNITFSNTVDGPGNLTLAAGSGVSGGNISLLGAIGGTTRLGALTISSAFNVSTQAISAASIVQTAGSGTTTLTGTLNTNTVTGISLNVTHLNSNGSIITTAAGPVSLTHSGTMTSVFGGSTSISGAFSQTGGAVSVSGTLTTVNQPLSFASALTLTGALSLNSGTGGANALTLSSTVNGAQTLTLSSGTGSMTLSGAIGGVTPLTSVVISSVNALSAQAITAGSLTQTAGSGTSDFHGALATSTVSGISLTGTNIHLFAPVTTAASGPFAVVNTGTLTIDAAAIHNLDGPFTQSGGGPVSLAANVISTADNISFGSAVTLTGPVTLDTNVGVGNVTFSGAVSGTGPLVITAGTGDVTVSGTIGATALSSLTASGRNITVANIGGGSAGVSGATSLTATEVLAFTGTTYHAQTQSYSANTISLQAGALTTFTTNGNPITLTAASMTLSATTNLAINSTLGAITLTELHATAASLRTVNLNAGATGVITLAGVGTAGNSELSSLALTGGNLNLQGNIFSNTVSFTSSGTIFLGGDITAVNALNFPVAVVRNNVITSTITTNAAIQFQSTLNGDGMGVRNVTLSAGAGSITLTGAVGGVNPLNALTLSSAANVTANALSIGTLTQLSGTGTSTFNGAIATTAVGGISLTGTGFTFNNTVTTTGGGGLTITNSGVLSLPVAATLSLSGPLNQLGAGSVQLADTITSADEILFTGPITLTGNTSLSTSAVNQEITFQNTVDGAFDLTMGVGTSNINCNADIGSSIRLGAFSITTAENINLQGLSATSISLTNGNGTVTFGNVSTDGGDITVVGNNFVSTGSVTTLNGGNVTITNSGTLTGTNPQPLDVDGFFLQNGTGPYFQTGLIRTHTGTVVITSPMTIVGSAQFDTTGGGMTAGQNITFMSTIDGTAPLDLTAGAGSILFSGALGSITALGAITIQSAVNVTAQAVIAASIAQSAGTGTTLLNGALSTSGAAGIALTATNITRGAAITTLNGGPLTITNSGTFTSTAAGTISLDGAFTQNGTGSVQLVGSIITTGDAISFASAVTLFGNVSLITGTGSGNITLSSTVQGAFNLTLDSDGGNTTLGGAVGTAMVPLTSVTIAHANNVTAQAITAGSITQQTGSGLSTFNGALLSTGASGISLTGTNFAINGTVTTQAGSSGPFFLLNSGTATFGSGATGSIDAAFSQNGTGPVSLSNTLVVKGAVQFQGAVSIPTAQSATINTSSTNTNILFVNSLDGPGHLTLLSGTGDITLLTNAGSISRLGAVTVSSVRNWTTQGIIAASILQSAGSGTTVFNSDLNTNAVGGISLTAAAISILGNATTTSSGPIAIVNSGQLTTTAGKVVTSSGVFSQSGGGAVSLAGSIVTGNANLSITGAITLTAPVALSIGVGTGSTISFNTVNGNQSFTLTAGGGDILANAAIGGLTRVGAITVISARNVTVQDITAASITQLAGTGTSSLIGNFNTNGPAGITMIGTNFSRTGAIVTTNGGSLVVTNSGVLSGTMINTTSIDGSYTQNGTGPTFFAGTITTLNGPISFSGPITLVSTSEFDSSNSSQDITLSNTVNGFAGTEALTLTAGNGSIILGSAVGGTTTIGPLTITNADNLTTQAVRAVSIATTNPMSGLATFNGTLTTSGASGIALLGNQMSFQSVTTSAAGPMSITNTGSSSFANASTLTIAGSFTQTGAGALNYGAALTTTSGTISFAAPITLTANSSVSNSGTGSSVTLSGALDGAHTMSVTAGTGTFTLSGSMGATTPLTGFTLVSAGTAIFQNNLVTAGPFTTTATGTTTFNGSLTATTGAISLTGTAINLNNSVTTNSGAIAISNTGPLTVASSSPISSSSTFIQSGIGGTVSLGSNITTSGALQLSGVTTLTSGVALNSGGGTLTLSSTVNSDAMLTPRHLTLSAGAGAINLNGSVGGTNPLNTLTFQSGAAITATAALNAASIQQTAGSGLTWFQGALTTTAPAGIALTGTQFRFDQAVTATGNGGLSIVHTGALTMNAASHALTGIFSESGGGAVSIAANISTTSDMITFSDQVTLTGNVTLDSTNGGMSPGATIHFSSLIDGPFCLTLASGTGNILLDVAVGSMTPLNCLSAVGTTIFQSSSVRTTTTVQETGAINLGGDITTTGSNITLTGNVTQTASATLSTGGGAGDIHITGTVNPNISGHNLTLQTMTGTVTLDQPIGAITPFNVLTITGDTINWNGLGGAGQGALGTTTVVATTDLNYTGTTYFGATQLYTAGSNFNMDVANTTVSSSGSPITFNTGTIQQNAGDLDLESNGGNITMGNLLGTGFNFSMDASSGDFVFTQIGAPGQNLNNVSLTATTFTPTPVLVPNPGTNVYAAGLSVNTPTNAILIGAQLIPATYTQPVLIQGAVTFSCGANGDVIFNQSVNADVGGGSLAINFGACTGSVTFNAPVGGSLPLTSISIDQPINLSINSSMTVGSFAETNGSGTATVAAGMTTTAAGGISLDSAVISLSGAFSTASSGPMALTHTGALTIASGTSFMTDGSFTESGGGTVSLGGVVMTHNSLVSFAGPTTLTGDLNITTSNPTGGNISFGSTINGTLAGAQSLSFSAGTGDITLSGALGGGTRLGTLTITTAHDVIQAAITATAYTQLAATGTTTFNGAVDLSGPSGMQLTGNALTFNNTIHTSATNAPIVVTNSGLLTLTASANLTPSGAFTQNGSGSNSLAGSVTSGGAISFATAATLTGATSLDASTNNRNITLSSTINDTTAHTSNLNLTAGSGTITVAGAIGGTTPIGALTVVSVGDLTTGAIAATSITQMAGSGLSTMIGNLFTSGGAGISLSGVDFTLNGTLTTAAASTGPVAITHTGILTLTAGMATSIDGAFTESGVGGLVNLTGTISSNALFFANPITLIGALHLNSNGGALTLDTVDHNFALDLTAGAGNIVFNGAIGASTAIGAFTVHSAGGATVTYPLINALSFSQLASSATTTLSGVITTTGSSGISITGSIINQNAALNTTAPGPVSLTNSGTLTIGAAITSGGAVTQTGAGGINLGANIEAANAAISFVGAITLTFPVTLKTGPVGNDITFGASSTIDGAQNLQLIADGGEITFGANVGGGTRIGTLTIQSASDVLASGTIRAASIAQQAGSGTTTFNGALDTNTLSGISLTGTNFILNANVTTTAAGSMTTNHLGSMVIASTSTLSLAQAWQQFGTGSTTLAGSITTTAGGIDFFGPMLTSGTTASLNSSAGNQSIIFHNTVSGNSSLDMGNLTLNSGSGDISFLFDAGASPLVSLGDLTITNAHDVTTQAVTATSITQVAGTGTTVCNSDLQTSGSAGINLSGSTITLLGNVETQGTGPMSVTNSLLFTISPNTVLTIAGDFTQIRGIGGLDTFHLAGTVQTINALSDITFNSPITLTAATTLDTNTGGGSIFFASSSTVNGFYPVTLNAGSGNLSIAGIIGGSVPIGAITVINAFNATITANITALSLTKLAGGGTSSVGTMVTPVNLTTTGPAGINIVGTNFFRNGSVTTLNEGPVVVTIASSGTVTGVPGGTITVDGPFTQNGTGIVGLAGTINTNNAPISFAGRLVLGGNAILNSGSTGADVTLLNTVDTTTGMQSLTILSGVGTITLTQPVGTTVGRMPLNNLTLTGRNISVANIGAVSAGVTGTTTLTATNLMTFSGTTYNANAQSYSAVNAFQMSAGSLATFSSNGQAMTFSGAPIQLGTNTNLTLNTSGGLLTVGTVHAGSTALRTLVMNSGAGNLQVGAVGMAGNTEFASISLTGANITFSGDLVSNAATFAPSGTLFAGAGIYTTNTPLSFPTSVVLQATNTFSTGTTGANISFANTLDGTVDDVQGITLLAGGGSITFTGTVGGIARLSSLQIDSAFNVTANDINVDALLQFSGSGTSTFNGAIFVPTAFGIQLIGTNVAINNTLTTLSTGSLSIVNSGTLALSSTANLSGAFSQLGTGPTTFSGSITAGQPVVFTGPVLLSGTPSIDTSVAGQSVSFAHTITGSGDLTIACGNGDLTLSSAVGTVMSPIGVLTITSNHDFTFTTLAASALQMLNATGTATLNGSIYTNGPLGILAVGNNFVANSGTITTVGGGPLTLTNSGTFTGTALASFNLDGFFLQNGTGPVSLGGTIQTNNQNISFSSPVTLGVATGLNSGAGAGTITFFNTLDGANALSLTAGTGDVVFSAAVGSSARLGTLTIVSAHGVTAGNITAGALIQNGSTITGTTTLSGVVNTNAAGGINLTAANVVRGSSWTTTNGGIVINNSGTFTSTAAGTIFSGGSFNQSGAGPVSLAQTVQTTSSPLSFSGPVTLAGSTLLDTGIGLGTITFHHTVNGTQTLSLTSGTGDIVFELAVGGTTRLGALTISLANNVIFAALKATTISQIAGSGTTTFGGSTDTTGVGGIQLTGSAFAVNAALTTTNLGPITISNSGQLTLLAPCIADGAFTQSSGVGLSVIGANLTSNTDVITFTGPVSLSGLPTLQTTTQPISFVTTLNGPGGLILNPGVAAITFGGAAGATTSLGALTFVNAQNINTQAITAGSVTQTAGTGTTTVLGDLTTNAIGGISLNGAAFTLTGALSSTNGGPCAIQHSGLLTLNAGASSLLSGPFSESGAGLVSLSGTLHAEDQTITFNNPITLIGSTTLNSDGGADITIVSAIDGAQDLVLNAGTDGNILIQADIGAITPITTLTITNAHDVTTQAINAGSIAQSAGSGLSTLGALTTTLNAGIDLSGNQFTFSSPVTTGGVGPVQITNTGLLSIPSGSTFTVGGAFSQLGAGSVSLCEDITTANSPIVFTGPVSLCSTVTLDSGPTSGAITFSNTLSGAQTLILNAGAGNINLNAAVSGLTQLQINSATNMTASSINVDALNVSGVTNLATFTSSLTTNGALGINLTGNAFLFQGPITTQNLGPMVLTNSGDATFSSTQVITLDGPFTQNGTGLMFIGGSLTTNNQAIQVQEDIILTGNFLLDSGPGIGNITLLDDADGPFTLTIQAGLGDVQIDRPIGDGVALANFTIASAHDITLNGIGNIIPGVTGTVSLTASNDINLGNVFYSGSQFYSAGNNINFISGTQVNLTTFGGSIAFTQGTIQLSSASDLNIQTNNGALSFVEISGAVFENIIVNTGSGAAHLNIIGGGGTINTLDVAAGAIDFAGTIDVTNTNLVSETTIANIGAPVAITSANTAFFNALGGDVGTLASPILVNTTNQIYAGADGHANSLANFNGSSFDNTVHEIPSNPPCIIIFNGVVIKNCTTPPTPPSGGRRATTTPSFPFAVPGFDSSFFNLASDYFFFFDFIDESYFRRNQLMNYQSN